MNSITSQFKAQAKSVHLFNRATASAAVLAGVLFIVDLVTLGKSGIGIRYLVPLLIGTLSGTAIVLSRFRRTLQIVFHNILTNAAQAMGGTGEVNVDIQRTADGWTLAFADHGPGLPPEAREKAFEPFFTTKHRATCLGLPTARRIVEAHGGEIAIDAPPEGGTVVSISLPAGR